MLGKRLINTGGEVDITEECDFFGDGKGRYLWTFNEDFNDTCGRFTGWNYVAGSISSDSKFGIGSYSAGHLWRNNDDYGGGLSGGAFLSSIWAKGTAWSDNRTSYLWDCQGPKLYVNSSNSLRFQVGSSTQGNITIGYDVSGLSSTEWHHIATTIDSTTSTYKLYVNGSEVASGTYGGYIILQNLSQFSIGAYLTDNGDGWKGLLDQYRLFYRPNPTAADVLALYNEGQ